MKVLQKQSFSYARMFAEETTSLILDTIFPKRNVLPQLKSLILHYTLLAQLLHKIILPQAR